MSQENVEIVRRGYESFNRWAAQPAEPFHQDPDVESLLHPDVEFHTYPNSPEAGGYRGRDAVIEYHQRLFQQFSSGRIEPHGLPSAGDRVVVRSRSHAPPK